MKLQYLGTAAAEGWPGLFCRCPACVEAAKRGGKNLRTRSQAIIDDHILMDFCPDTYMHMLQHGIDLPNIKTCLLTHTHEDHLYIEDLKMRCKWFASDIDDVPFTIYGNDALMRCMENFKAGPSGQLWVEGIDWKELQPYETTEIEDYRVTPTLANHNPKERCFNYIIEKDAKTLFYGHDSGYFVEETWAQLEKHHFDYVSLDCTMLMSTHTGTHMNIKECCKVRERMLEKGCADEHTIFCINHFSHNGGMNVAENKLYLHEELVPYMAERGFMVSYDGMTVEF